MELKSIYNTVKNIDFRDVVYANEQWILTGYKIGDNGDTEYHLCITSDLKSWDDQLIYKASHILPIETPKICYGNGVYIYTIKDVMFISKDLESWEQIPIKDIIIYAQSTSLFFVNNQFVFTSWTDWVTEESIVEFEGQILTSKDGKSWTKQVTLDKALMDITFYQGRYYIVGSNGYCASSYDLKQWTKSETKVKEQINVIASGSSGLVAATSNKIVLFSIDGNNWIRVFEDNDTDIANIEYGNGIYMIMSKDSSIAYSKDGRNWFWLRHGLSGYNYGMCFSQEQQMFLLCGNHWVTDQTGAIFIVTISREIVSSSSDKDVLYVYDLDFNFIGIIDSFKSLRWRRKYFEAGDFEIVVTPDEVLVDTLHKNYLILRDNYTEAGIIETIQMKDDGTDEDFSISGRFLSSVLDRRIVRSIIHFKGSTVDGMKQLLNSMTPFPSFEIENTTFDSREVEFQCSYKNVYEYLVKLSKYSNVGFRIVPNLENKVFIFENYQGLDRTIEQDKNERYSFSDEESNLDTASLTISTTNKINSVLVGGSGEGTDRKFVEVKEGNPTGFDLYESFVDSKNQSANNLSNDEYELILKQDGNSKISEEITTFEFAANAEDYKDKFDLGDIVNVSKSKWNYVSSARIIEIEEVIEDGIRTITLSTGTPLPEDFKE